MVRFLFPLILFVWLPNILHPETSQAPADSGLAAVLGFEGTPEGGAPAGWKGGPPKTVFADGKVKRSGEWSARIERRADSPEAFSTLTRSLPMNFAGSRIELRGFLRTASVDDFVGLWMREDGDTGCVGFENMEQRQLKGSTEWSEYSIALPLAPAGRQLFFGVLLSGPGKVWADDLQLLVDGKPVWEAPKAELVQTVLDRDREFVDSSKVVLSEITPNQVSNLATLARVWGFLKYHHPKVTSGQLHWDFELFRILPPVLAANDSAASNALLLRWIDTLGPVPADPRPALDDAAVHLRPDLSWIDDETALGQDLSNRLRTICSNTAGGTQFFVSPAPAVGNPEFPLEPSYSSITSPDPGYQLLGLFRYWNIIRYWYPYRDLTDDWNVVLREFIPRIALAKDSLAYQRELMAVIAKVQDAHAALWSSIEVRPPVGDGRLPIEVRFLGRLPVVTEVHSLPGSPPSALRRGDVITALDGTPIAELIACCSPYYAAPNEPTHLRDFARWMGRGPIGPAKVRVQRGDTTLEIDALRIPNSAFPADANGQHDLPGPAFRLLSKEVAYLKLSSAKAAAATDYIQEAAGTTGWIIDIRNYPAESLAFALGTHLVDRPTEFVRFTIGNPGQPGSFSFTPPLTLNPQPPCYAGKIILLVDEATQSAAEYAAMAFRAAPGALVIGSTTAGADGNVSEIPLPGGFSTWISGIGVFYPDKRPTQRVGIIPDVVVNPTLAGIRAGRDEVLEEALRRILGPETSPEELSRLARPSD